MSGLVLVLGPTGAGKSSVAAELAERHGFRYLCSGDLMRELLSDPTIVGDEIRDYNDRDLPPDAIAQRRVLAVLADTPPAVGVVLDGFPRTAAQAAALSDHLRITGRPLLRVVHVDACETTSLRRCLRRHCCVRCGAMLAAEPGAVCVACGAVLQRRQGGEGDAAMTRRRRGRFLADTVPVIAAYSQQNLVVRLDGEQPLPAVLARAFALLDPLMRQARVSNWSSFVLAKPEAAAGRRLAAIYEFLIRNGFPVVDVRPVHLDAARVRKIWGAHLDRAPAAVVRTVELNAAAAPFTLFSVGDATQASTTERLGRLKGRATATPGDGSLRGALGVTAPVMNFIHTPDTPDTMLAELQLLLTAEEAERVLDRLATGTPLDPAAAHAAIEEIYRAVEHNDLDPATSRARLTAVAGAGLAALAEQATDPDHAIDPQARHDLIMELAATSALPVWDRLTLMAHAVGDSRRNFGMVPTKDLTP